MNLRRITIEHLLYILAFLLALGLRLYNLGAAPLSDAEASQALQALAASGMGQDTSVLPVSSQPGYVVLTGAAFFLFGSTNFLARFWPAVSGSLLPLLPLLFLPYTARSGLGRVAGLILAFGLALDPGLAAVSRQAGGTMMALAFTLLTLGGWTARRPVQAGVCAALALLSGPDVLAGALSLALAWGIYSLANRGTEPPAQPEYPNGSPSVLAPEKKDRFWRPALLTAAGVLLLVGTLFLRYPQGLGALFGSLLVYWQGWTVSSGDSAGMLLLALLAYGPLALIFGCIGAARAFFVSEDPDLANQFFIGRRGSQFLFIWALVALLLALLYPAHQVADLIWVLVPLWVLAAVELSHYLQGAAHSVSAGHALLIFTLLALFWISLAALNRAAPVEDLAKVRFAVLFGILALVALSTALISLGWSWDTGRRGLVWGVAGSLGVYLVSALWGATQLRSNLPQELWAPAPAGGQAALFLDTLEGLSRWQNGFIQTLDVTATVDSPSMRWALRDFRQARFISEPAAGSLPSVVITRAGEENPALAASYRGQDFTWWQTADWIGPLPPNLANWLAYREAPLRQEQIILWARSDLFPGESTLQE